MTGDCLIFKFLRRGVDGKHLMYFQSEFIETSAFKFLLAPCGQGLTNRFSLLVSVYYLATISYISRNKKSTFIN